MSQISKNSVGMTSPMGGQMMAQPGMQQHHHPYMSSQPHQHQQHSQQHSQQHPQQHPQQRTSGMMLSSMSPGPVSQRMPAPPSPQQSPYSPQHNPQQHNVYGMSQPTHMTGMLQNSYGGTTGGPMHAPMHHTPPHRHPIIAARSNNPRPQAIVAQHSNYPRSKPSRHIRSPASANSASKGANAQGESGGGEPAREPLRDVVTLPHPHLANTKEKTPMCLVNELARYNKVSVQYILEDEQGPAHQKLFFMKLKVGEEEYSGTEASIRKAQQHVASMALERTELKKPPERPEGSGKPSHGGKSYRGSHATAPTVELNSLVMRRGEEAIYRPIKPRQQTFVGHPNFNYHGMYTYGRMPVLNNVSLKIGPREFVGFGPTPKIAKNNAATKALRILRHLPMPAKEVAQDGEPSTVTPTTPANAVEAGPGEAIKSEISLIHEIALKRDIHVSFEMMREVGPAHKKMFMTRCILGDLMCESEAQSKKESKRMAAEKMLNRLRQNGPLPVSEVMVPGKNAATNKKKTKNLIKTQKGDTSYGIDINPISRLIQIMQAQKKKEPEYSFVAERGFPRRKEFIMQVQCDGKTCNGVAQNKKLAKRNAAEAMLNHLGLNQPSPVPGKPALKNSTSSAANDATAGDKRVSFVESGSGEAMTDKTDRSGRQIIPGLIHLPERAEPNRAVNTPYVKGRVPGIADPADLGVRRLASGGDGGHVTSGMPAHLQQELTRMVNSHNMDIAFNNTPHTEGSGQHSGAQRGNMTGVSDRSVTVGMGINNSERMNQGGAMLSKR